MQQTSHVVVETSARATREVIDFVHDMRFGDLPDAVASQALTCLRDLLSAAADGSRTALSRIIRDHCARNFGAEGTGVRMLLDGRRISAPGAALAGGMTIDAFDSHDGHPLTKGHAGVAVLPAALACADTDGADGDGRAFLADLVVGYEVAIRAGIATHRICCDYHTSGSWNALGAAMVAARRLRLDAGRTRHALGIAEYHGPRSQMMRCIDHPTMLKDGSGWGAMVGMSAADLAAAGFTGAPALVVESADVADLWADLGARWRILELYFKPYPICRWAQPAVEAALSLCRAHGLGAADIRMVEVATFHEAWRLATRRPTTTEEAQYSLPFPVAAAIARGRLGAAEVDGDALRDPEILRLADAMILTERQAFNARFPAERLAQVAVTTMDGRRLESAVTTTRGDPATSLPDDALPAKFRASLMRVLDSGGADALARAIDDLPRAGSAVAPLLDIVLRGGEAGP